MYEIVDNGGRGHFINELKRVKPKLNIIDNRDDKKVFIYYLRADIASF